jgi:transposase
LVNEVLAGMGAHFEEMCIESGRPAIPPERLLKAKGLMALFLVRRDRQCCARLRHDLLFR